MVCRREGSLERQNAFLPLPWIIGASLSRTLCSDLAFVLFVFCAYFFPIYVQISF